MTDTRVRVPLDGKKIDLAQLATEIGADLSASDAEVVVTDDDSPVTADALAAAVKSHTPPPPPVEPLTDDEVTRLRALLAKNP